MMRAPSAVVGRGEELACVAEFVDEVEPPAALLLQGEPGIGKTTLWELGVAQARERGQHVLACRPAEAESELSFAALADLLDGVLEDVVALLPAPQARALRAALLLEDVEGPRLDRRAVGAAFLNGVRELEGDACVTLAVDDVQWLDRASAGVLEFALRRLGDRRVKLLLAQRVETRARVPLGLDRALAGRLERIVVEPLTLGAVHQLLFDGLGLVLSRPALRRLHDLSGGNPFYALELGRAHQSGTIRLEPGERLPGTLQELVSERLSALAAETQQALALAAALSRPTTALVDESALAPALAAHIVELDGDEVRFAHPLLASAAYGRLGPTERRRLHRRLADAVTDPEERGRHLALAAEGPDERVARALDEASTRAGSRGAQDAAADLCARARELTTPGDTDMIRRRGLREAEYALQSGDTPRARAVLESLLAISPTGTVRAEILKDLGRVHFNGLDWASSVGLLEQALDEASEDVPLRGEIELHLAINLDLLRTDVRDTLVHARAAVALAEQLGDETMLAEALVIQAKNELLLGRGWPRGLVERALELEAATAVLPADRSLSDYLATMRGWMDDFGRAIGELENVQRVALERGDEVSLNWALARVAKLKCGAGDWPAALRDVERGSAIALQAGQTANQAIFLALTALVHAHQGVEASAREAGQRALALAESTGATMARRTALAALGLLELSLGRAQEADGHLAPLTAETQTARVGEPGAMRFVPDRIEALVRLGRLAEAEVLLDSFDERAHATERASALATSARCRGLLRSARGEAAGALDLLEEALGHHERVPIPFERARTLLVLGEVRRRARQKRPARDALEEAVAVFELLGARIWSESGRAELARIGGRSSAAGLTPSEHRLARLVAEGRSNKEIAAALFVTPKTVETKLSRLYAKLGIHSRSELIRRVTAGKLGELLTFGAVALSLG